ncbi:DNA topoisomerase [Pseudomonas aeruginosa]|nr:DNA topoisomerase [Pseudomonas aeruginosa]
MTSAWSIRAWRGCCGAAWNCPARTCCSTWTRTASRTASAPTTSTSTCAGIPARISAPKDYRTWAGSALALERLRRAEADGLGAVVAEVAAELGNSVAICRQCYIHPAIIEAYQAGQLGQLRRARKRRWLSAEEATLLAFLDTPG